MAVRATPEVVRAVAMLSRNPLWNEVDKLFASELAETYTHLAGATDEVKLRQLQGRAQLIQEIQALVRDAPSKAEKFQKSGTS